MNTKVNHREAYFISCTFVGKISHRIESRILGPFYDYVEARRILVAEHSRHINLFKQDITSTYVGECGSITNIETDLFIFQFDLFSKTVFI